MSEVKTDQEQCPGCAELRERLDRIREIVLGNGDARRGRRPVEFESALGKAIAVAAFARGMKLSEVSRAANFASDQVPGICRGTKKLTKRSAILIGAVLGIDLTGYVQEPQPATIPHDPQPPGIQPGQEA